MRRGEKELKKEEMAGQEEIWECERGRDLQKGQCRGKAWQFQEWERKRRKEEMRILGKGKERLLKVRESAVHVLGVNL